MKGLREFVAGTYMLASVTGGIAKTLPLPPKYDEAFLKVQLDEFMEKTDPLLIGRNCPLGWPKKPGGRWDHWSDRRNTRGEYPTRPSTAAADWRASHGHFQCTMARSE